MIARPDAAGIPAPADEEAAAPTLEAQLEAQAYGLGFDLVGIARLGEVGTAAAFDRWVARGYAGEMAYLPKWADKRRDTRLPFPGVVSAVVVAMDYGGRELSGPVARYARGDDYHDLMVERLRALHAWLDERLGRPVRGKAYVDTGPILERDLARKAGLGWFGKNTMLVNPRIGSFFFLGALLVEAELEPDEAFEADRCGTCRRCIEACPTGAIVDERVLDATRCISYLTIEQRGEIPVELREKIGGLLYGCDICQEVCPWNVSFAKSLPDDSTYAAREALRGRDARQLARELLAMSQEEFSATFRKSPMKRAKLRGLKRNAAVVLGNVGSADDLDVLTRALDDEEPLAREHAAWALRRIAGRPHSGTTARSFATRGIGGSLSDMTERTTGITVRKLRERPDAGLSGSSTPAERLVLVETLTREAWTLAGLAAPAYTRRETPVAVRPLRATARPTSG